jgi:hypothetical protein
MSTITELRLQLLENDYSPIRNRDKRTFMKGWPDAEITPELIATWGRKHKRDTATGLRVEDGLAVIDLDINDKQAVNNIADRIFDEIPKLGEANDRAALLVRRGKGFKEAWFVRTEEEFGRIHSRSWTRPGEGVDEGTHRVEIFGGASARQFGAFGPHTVLDDGTVAVEYAWPDRSPADTPQSELPELTKAEFFRIADIVEEELAKLGWSKVERSSKGENDAIRVYDLDDTMSFDLNNGDTVSLQRLRELAAADPDGGLRCSASFLEGAEAVNRTRCLVTVTRTGNLAIWESAAGVTHCEASLKPKDYSVAINRLQEMWDEKKDRRKNKVRGTDDATAAAAKLLRSHAFCPWSQANMVPLWASTMDDGIMMAQARILYAPNCDEEIGPRGGIRRINPLDLWATSSDRITVRGMRLRPDKERPTYEEGGQLWVNIYAPPAHDEEGGYARGGLVLLEQLLPDETEREWFTRWLAHKLRYPHIPGPAVVMVARSFGTGRGTLAELIRRLFGSNYVHQIAFEAFTGKTYQSQYNEWMATSLMVVVNESDESDGSKYQTKRNTYERLKEIVDPAPVERAIYTKREKNFRALSFTSFIIATNHDDALPIPAEDRRFAVLSNGEPRDEGFWQEVREWMSSDANVAAFYRYLMSEVDLGDYSPFAPPPRTEAKATMVEAGKSDLDKGIDAAADTLGDVFTLDQLVRAMEEVKRDLDLEYPVGNWAVTARKVAARRFTRVGIRDGKNWHVKHKGKKFAVYAKLRDRAAFWKGREGLREAVFGDEEESGSNVASLSVARSLKQSLKNVRSEGR